MKAWPWIALGLVTALSVGAQLACDDARQHWWDKLPGFWGAFGFAGAATLIGLASWWGRRLALREEDYYDQS